MYDSVTISEIPADAVAVAGYVAGSWPTYNSLVAQFPHAHHLSIAPQASEVARCLDVEPGDAVNAQAPAWYRTNADTTDGMRILYTSASNSQALINVMSASGINRDQYLLWSAHYTGNPHICAPGVCGFPQADLTQYTDTALGRNLDASLVSDHVFGPPPPPPKPPDAHHYERFPTGPFNSRWGKLDERKIVQHYDTARPHFLKDRVELKLLREQLRYLADRVWALAHEQTVDGKPSWDRFHRGWRYQELDHRAEGETVKT